jgi:F0F1-type ATP synthase assembly protein I
MEIASAITDERTLLEILSAKIGGFSIYLGIMLFFNLYLFFRGRRVSKERAKLAEALAKIPGNERVKSSDKDSTEDK